MLSLMRAFACLHIRRYALRQRFLFSPLRCRAKMPLSTAADAADAAAACFDDA